MPRVSMLLLRYHAIIFINVQRYILGTGVRAVVFTLLPTRLIAVELAKVLGRGVGCAVPGTVETFSEPLSSIIVILESDGVGLTFVPPYTWWKFFSLHYKLEWVGKRQL